MKTFRNSLMVLALGSLALPMGAFAQSGAGPGVNDPNHPRVNQVNRRAESQQARIANGVRNGSLTPRETARVEHGEQRLVRNEKRDMRKDNGHLTKQDQRQLNREENHLSKRIARDKHNGARQ